MKTTETTATTKPTKRYYEDEQLNRLANTVWHGRVFGEKTLLEIRAECGDEAQFVQAVQESL